MSLRYRDEDDRIAAGDLRHYGTLQRQQASTNKLGAPLGAWVALDNVYFAIEPTSGSERVIGQQLNSINSHKITMRYYEGLKSSDRLVFRGIAYNFNNINNVKMTNRKFVIYAMEGGPGA